MFQLIKAFLAKTSRFDSLCYTACSISASIGYTLTITILKGLRWCHYKFAGIKILNTAMLLSLTASWNSCALYSPNHLISFPVIIPHLLPSGNECPLWIEPDSQTKTCFWVRNDILYLCKGLLICHISVEDSAKPFPGVHICPEGSN